MNQSSGGYKHEPFKYSIVFGDIPKWMVQKQRGTDERRGRGGGSRKKRGKGWAGSWGTGRYREREGCVANGHSLGTGIEIRQGHVSRDKEKTGQLSFTWGTVGEEWEGKVERMATWGVDTGQGRKGELARKGRDEPAVSAGSMK